MCVWGELEHGAHAVRDSDEDEVEEELLPHRRGGMCMVGVEELLCGVLPSL